MENELIRGTAMISVGSDPGVKRQQGKVQFVLFCRGRAVTVCPSLCLVTDYGFVALRKRTGSRFRPITEGEGLRLERLNLRCIDQTSTELLPEHRALILVHRNSNVEANKEETGLRRH